MKKYTLLDKESMLKLAKGACLAGGAAFLTFALVEIAKMDFGAYTPMVVAMIGILLNAIKVFVQGEK